MKTFNLIVRESKIIRVSVEAEDLLNAIDLAESKYSDGEYDILMNNGDYEAVEVFVE